MGCEPASAAAWPEPATWWPRALSTPHERVVCILTGHLLKDPNATVAYHTTDQELFNEVLGKRGVRRGGLRQPAVSVPNDPDEIIKAIRLYS